MLTTISIFLEGVEVHQGGEAIVFRGENGERLCVILMRKNALRCVYEELHKIYGADKLPFELETADEYRARLTEETMRLIDDV